MGTETSQTLHRGLRLVELLADHPAGLSVTEIAQQFGLSRPIVYRLLATLQAHGLVHRMPDGRSRVGLAVLRLSRGVLPLLREAAAGPLRRLAEDARATAHLTVRDGDEALAVAVVEPSRTDLHVAYRVGARHPLDRGAAGHAIRALWDGAGAPAYAVSIGELQPGAHGVAAPLREVPGLEASVGVVALADLDVHAVAERVIAAAREVAAALRGEG